MSTDSIQGILSRLYTDIVFRKEFIADKKLFYKKYAIISEKEIEFIEAIPVEQLVFFAQSLLQKRMHELKNLIPGTSILVGKKINELLLEHFEMYVPNGIHKHHDDAITFINYLLKQAALSDNKDTDRFIRSVLCYELQRIKNFTASKRFLISIYKYDVSKNYPLLLKNEEFKVPSKKFTFIIWKKGRIII
jgi:hypothetical protein